MRNRGVELSLTTNIIRKKDWNFAVDFNFDYNKNKMLKVDHSESDNARVFIASPQVYFMEGTSYNTLWAYRIHCIENGYPVAVDKDGNDLVKFNEDGTVASITSGSSLKGTDDLVNLGSLTPKFSGSVGLRFNYKNFDLNAFFVYAGGNKLRNSVLKMDDQLGTQTLKGIANRWTADDSNAQVRMYLDIPAQVKTYASTFQDWWQYGDINVKDAGYVKLRSLSVGYNLPFTVCQHLRLSSLKVKVQEPSKHVLNINDGTPDWLKVSFTTSAGFKNTSVTNSEKEGLQISFLYNSTSAKTISLAGDIPLYSLPDTLRIHINPGEAKVKTFSCTLKLPSKKTVAVDLPIPEANKENICDIAFPDVLGDVFDIANYPLVLSHFTLGMDINTLGQNYRIDIPAVELVYNYYNENASDVQTVEGKSLDLSVSGRTILLGKAVDRVELYNVSGCLISLTENSNHISAPGIGMYIMRIVTEGKVFSQKIWINR